MKKESSKRIKRINCITILPLLLLAGTQRAPRAGRMLINEKKRKKGKMQQEGNGSLN